jgi:hypothetical protein
MTEVSPSENYRIDTINKLKQLEMFHDPKPFKDMTKQDVVDLFGQVNET